MGDYGEQYEAGTAALWAGQTAEAIAALTQATQAEPEEFDAWLALGEAHAMADDRAAAEAAFERAGALRPSDARVPLNLGRLARRAGETDRALHLYARAAELNSSGSELAEAHAAPSSTPSPAARTAGESAVPTTDHPQPVEPHRAWQVWSPDVEATDEALLAAPSDDDEALLVTPSDEDVDPLVIPTGWCFLRSIDLKSALLYSAVFGATSGVVYGPINAVRYMTSEEGLGILPFLASNTIGAVLGALVCVLCYNQFGCRGLGLRVHLNGGAGALRISRVTSLSLTWMNLCLAAPIVPFVLLAYGLFTAVEAAVLLVGICWLLAVIVGELYNARAARTGGAGGRVSVSRGRLILHNLDVGPTVETLWLGGQPLGVASLLVIVLWGWIQLMTGSWRASETTWLVMTFGVLLVLVFVLTYVATWLLVIIANFALRQSGGLQLEVVPE